MEQEKQALAASHAGMRMIAQISIYNMNNTDRLQTFIADGYHPKKLDEQSVDDRLAEFASHYEALGKLKFKQVMATGEYLAIVVLQAQKAEGFYYVEMGVEKDYPHRINHYMFQQLKPIG
jgi:hypothetical protein